MFRRTTHRSRSILRFPALAVVLLVAQSGCAPSAALRSARAGDWTGLRAALTAERARHRLDAASLAKLAAAVAAREITTGRGEDGLARIEDVKPCTLQLRDALQSRSRREESPGDSVAAAATLALLDGGPRPSDLVDRQALMARADTGHNPYWRAAAARASTSPERVRFFVDPDERVRLAALRGALDQPAVAEREALATVARLDPNPLARSLAIRVLVALGGTEVVLTLNDLYEHADVELRVAIVDAWAMPAATKQGAERYLIRVAQANDGIASISAASALLSMNDEAASVGLSALLHLAVEGTPTERVLAIRRLPFPARSATASRDVKKEASKNEPSDAKTRAFPETQKVLDRAASSGDKLVRLAALVRMVELPGSETRARQELRTLASQGSRAALFALAEMGDRAALDPLRRELPSADPEARLSIGRSLMTLAGATEGADLLADQDAHVRTSGACALLLRSAESR